MSKLSQIAWRRNGLFGRITAARNTIRQLNDATLLRRNEQTTLIDIDEILTEMLTDNSKNWSKWKKRNIKKL